MPYWPLCKRPSEKAWDQSHAFLYVKTRKHKKGRVFTRPFVLFQTALRLKQSTFFMFAAKAVVRFTFAFKAFATFFETVFLKAIFFETVFFMAFAA